MLVFLWSLSGQAQCNLKDSRRAAGSTVHEANFEILYKNVGKDNDGDYSLGSIQVQARLFTIDSPGSTYKSWGLSVAVGGSRLSEVIVPRTLVFSFQNGSFLMIDAASYQDLDGIKMCTFDLNQNNINALSNPIQKVEIIDNRTHQSYTSSQKYGLYPNVLVEQAKCLY